MSERGLDGRVEQLRAGLQGFEPDALADRAGASYLPTGPGQGEFHLGVWGQAARVTYPGFITLEAERRTPLPTPVQALVLYYFSTCDGTRPAGRWISFSELLDGRFYNQAFQGYTGKPLAQAFGNDLEAFRWAARSLGGEHVSFGDAAFQFQALPHVPLLAAYWLGDEDFPPACQIQFDANVSHHLPTDACAILGSTLACQLLKQRRESSPEG